jgi:hypothetical protein
MRVVCAPEGRGVTGQARLLREMFAASSWDGPVQDGGGSGGASSSGGGDAAQPPDGYGSRDGAGGGQSGSSDGEPEVSRHQLPLVLLEEVGGRPHALGCPESPSELLFREYSAVLGVRSASAAPACPSAARKRTPARPSQPPPPARDRSAPWRSCRPAPRPAPPRCSRPTAWRARQGLGLGPPPGARACSSWRSQAPRSLRCTPALSAPPSGSRRRHRRRRPRPHRAARGARPRPVTPAAAAARAAKEVNSATGRAARTPGHRAGHGSRRRARDPRRVALLKGRLPVRGGQPSTSLCCMAGASDARPVCWYVPAAFPPFPCQDSSPFPMHTVHVPHASARPASPSITVPPPIFILADGGRCSAAASLLSLGLRLPAAHARFESGTPALCRSATGCCTSTRLMSRLAPALKQWPYKIRAGTITFSTGRRRRGTAATTAGSSQRRGTLATSGGVAGPLISRAPHPRRHFVGGAGLVQVELTWARASRAHTAAVQTPPLVIPPH